MIREIRLNSNPNHYRIFGLEHSPIQKNSLNRLQLIQQIKTFSTGFSEESALTSQFLDLLEHRDAYQRDHLPGHITGSAWIVNKDSSKVLLVLHANLGRWLQPGGHADGDEDVFNVARREAEEETGLRSFQILSPSVFDLDIHPIPARKSFPEHLHYDVRFLLQASEDEPLVISDESRDLKWIAIPEIGPLTGNAVSIARMVSKTLNLKKN
jgi:8-oxo-dGTP pyrophosphatase MutT (NUDIX family)